MTEGEINNYCSEHNITYRFELVPIPVKYKPGRGEEDLPPGLNETRQLNEEGLNLIVGHDFSLANRYSLECVEEKDMLLLSPSGIGLGLSKPDDGLFKLMPNECDDPEVYAEVLANLLETMGYRAFITIGTGEHLFMREWLDVIGERLSYPYHETEVVLNINAEDYGPYIEQAAKYVNDTVSEYGVDKVCVLIEPFWVDELERLLNKADEHDILSKVEWFDYGGIPEEAIAEYDLENRVAKYGFTKLIMHPAQSPQADEFYQSYREQVGALPTPSKLYDEAARYDACWIMAQSVIQANSTHPLKVKEALPIVCESYKGVLGDCSLNLYGDRKKTDYRIYEWTTLDDGSQLEAIGHYSASDESFTFFR